MSPLELEQEFHRATTRLVGAKGFREDRFVAAVSGGSDSMAMMILAHRWFGPRLAAVTVDHGLRPESAAEALHVASTCAVWGIAHAILTPIAPITGSIQAAARTARYALLEEWRAANGFQWIMTAHHADDQLETMVMRVRRGSGVAGLSGIRGRMGTVIRPLLVTTKSDLHYYAAAARIQGVEDPSNQDSRFERVRIRDILSKLKISPVTAAASASHLSEADEALEWMTQRLLGERLDRSNPALARLNVAGLPRELRRRLLCRVIAEMSDSAPRGRSVDLTLDLLADGRAAMLCDLSIGAQRQTPDIWTIRPAPPRRAPTSRSD